MYYCGPLGLVASYKIHIAVARCSIIQIDDMLRPNLLLNSCVCASRRVQAAAAARLGRSSIFTASSPHLNLHEPAIIDFDMPPDYESQAFWDNRFKQERHFEWLGDGQETIVPVLRPVLQAAAVPQPTRIPRVLHIGAGTSTLSDHILALYREVFGERLVVDPVVNTDFAGQVVERGRAAERIIGTAGVRWEQADLLSWRDVVSLRERCRLLDGSAGPVFDVVVDKSTSDAISCGDTITITQDELTATAAPTSPSPHPLLCAKQALSLQLEPLELLALHLAALVQPGGLWIALSYSSDRFPFLVRQEGKMAADVRVYWDVEGVRTVHAPSGWGRSGEGASVHIPEIMHHLYTFRRTAVPFA